MSTITETPRGWSFVFRGERYEYPTRQQAQEALYDLQHGKAPAPLIDDDPLVGEPMKDAHCVSTDDSRPIRVENWRGGEGSTHTWQDFSIGERVTVGVLTDRSKPGIELTIAGNAINEDLTDIWTLDDLRRLRDDLSDLLADDRLLAATGSAASPILVTRRDDLPCPCTEYHATGGVFIEVLDSPDPVAGGDGLTVWNMGGDCTDLASAEQDARDLLTLLADPRVRAAIEARRAA
jgi:hypothetical protein